MELLNLAPLDIALIVLCVSGIWAIVEVALTLRTTRRKVDELTTTVNATVAELQPVIAKLDGVVDEVNPAVKQVEPLLGKVGNAVDAVTLDLIRVDDILGDVSGITGTASSATNSVSGAVSRAAGAAGDAATGLIGRITGHAKPEGGAHAKISPSEDAAAAPEDESASEVPEDLEVSDSVVPVDPEQNYFTYSSAEEAPQKDFKPVLKRRKKKSKDKATDSAADEAAQD